MVMRELHERPSRRHFVIKQRKGRYWMLDIGGQLCTEMCMINVDLAMHVKEQEDWQLKVLQNWSQIF
jgi:hypothetical protein